MTAANFVSGKTRIRFPLPQLAGFQQATQYNYAESASQIELGHDVRFGSKADLCIALARVCLAQQRTFGRSLDHLIGASDKRRRQSEVERLSGLEIDRQIEPGRLFGGTSPGLLPRRSAASCRDMISP